MAPSFPLALRTKFIGAYSANLTWSKLPINCKECSERLTGYILRVAKQDFDEDSFDIQVAPEEECFTINDLEPCTEYNVKIAAVNDFGRGPFSPPVMFKTEAGKIHV